MEKAKTRMINNNITIYILIGADYYYKLKREQKQ